MARGQNGEAVLPWAARGQEQYLGYVQVLPQYPAYTPPTFFSNAIMRKYKGIIRPKVTFWKVVFLTFNQQIKI